MSKEMGKETSKDMARTPLLSESLSESLYALAQEMNEDLGKSFRAWTSSPPDDETLPWAWIDRWSSPVAFGLYQAMPHWHYVTGECLQEVPFEIRMMAVSVVTTAWTQWLWNRKAVDRKRPRMARIAMDHRKALDGASAYIRKVVWATRDPRAEQEFKEKRRRRNMTICQNNTAVWGH